MSHTELKAMKVSQTTGDLRGLSAKESAMADIRAAIDEQKEVRNYVHLRYIIAQMPSEGIILIRLE
jgi:hypothetical protein